MNIIEQGEKIKQARVRRGLKQKEVADFLGMSDKNYSKIELGQVGVNLEYVSKLCHLLGLSELEFLSDRRTRTKNWEDLFQIDLGRMFIPGIDHNLYIDMLLKQYLTEDEITIFNEIMKIKKVEYESRYIMLVPFLHFLEVINKYQKDPEIFYRYLKTYLMTRKNTLNDEFRKG